MCSEHVKVKKKGCKVFMQTNRARRDVFPRLSVGAAGANLSFGSIYLGGWLSAMRELGHRSSSTHLLAVVVVVLVWLNCGTSADQQYNNQKGYFCSDSGRTSCNTFVLYRSQAKYSSVQTIARLFNSNASAVARLNKLSSRDSVAINNAVLVPIVCRCGANDTSFANVSYAIVKDDTFYNLNANNFESLSTVQAVLSANSELDPNDLQIGQRIVFPVRCACPSKAQLNQNVRALVTYPVVDQDTVGQISTSFGVPTAAVQNGNTLTGANSQILAETTLLIPIKTSQPNYTAPVLAPLAAPTPSNGNAPAPLEAPGAPPQGHDGGSSNTGVYVAIGVGVCAAILILAGIGICTCLALRKRREKSRRKGDTEAPLVAKRDGMISSSPGVSGSSEPSGRTSTGVAVPPDHPLAGVSDLLGSDKPTLFTYEQLCEATDNFNESNRIQGSVFRGTLNGQVVAIKQMKGNVSQELRILCRVHHTNLIRLVGLCAREAEQLYLVYEYAENGSLSDCLHNEYLSRNNLGTQSSSYLSWTARIQIALDTASGLEYIHDYVKPSYVHKDVKSSNILLDGALRAKIANFAMAKAGDNKDLMTRHIAGTYGYMAPEYLAHGLVTPKADVFAFGVVLLELLSGNEAISEEVDGEESCLYSSVRPILESEDPRASLKRWMDPVLENNYPLETALSTAMLAKSCVDMDPVQRPSMKDITFALSKLLNSSLEWEPSSHFAHNLADTPVEAR